MVRAGLIKRIRIERRVFGSSLSVLEREVEDSEGKENEGSECETGKCGRGNETDR